MGYSHQVKCKKGHWAHPVSYRDNETQSPVRIFNYWYCDKCNKVFKKNSKKLAGVNAD